MSRFERLLTALRASLANDAAAGKPVADTVLGFACALARQCFINEYVFATTPEEDAKIEDLRARARRRFAERDADRRARDVLCRCTRCRPLRRCSNGNGLRTSRRC